MMLWFEGLLVVNKILRLKNDYELWLTYSWSNNNHGICGHTFEVIEYYLILKEHYKVGIVLCEDITWEQLNIALRSKYDLTEIEIENVKENTIFSKRPKLVSGKNIIFTDGGMKSTKNCVLLFDNIIHLACGDLEIKNNDKNNVWILQDYRVYDRVLKNGVDYKKKILFDRFKKIKGCDNRALLYGTKNCRSISRSDYEEISDLINTGIIAITNEENKPNYEVVGVEFVVPPLENIFEKFDTYVYTPVDRRWDCSPRFIAECEYYGKEVIYYKIDYWEEDKGLYWRKWDVENDFESISLKQDDELVGILRGIIGG